jgi:hypothetical protein
MSQERQLSAQQYDPTKHDTAAIQQAVGCPYTRQTMILSDDNGCGKRCPHFQQLIPMVADRQVAGKHGENGKPVVERVQVGVKVACNYPTLRDVVAVHAVVALPQPAGVVPFPTQPPAPGTANPDAEKATAPAPDPAAG